MKTDGLIRTVTRGILALGLALSLLGLQAHSAAASASPSLTCPTSPVRLSLAGEQITFCAPTGLPFSASEDSRNDPNVHYAGLDQLGAFAFINIRAVASGSAAGPSMPVYTGNLEDYRQAVQAGQAAQTHSRLSTGPVASLWGQEAAGLQVDYSLSTSLGDLSLRSFEWDVEHNGRLWVFFFTWDTRLQNSAEWQQAAEHFTVQDVSGAKLKDTAVDLGALQSASLQPGAVQPAGGPIDMGAPSWWSGECDDGNYSADPATNHDHSYPLGGSWHGVDACGPRPLDRGYSGHLVNFSPGAWGQYEFQCVELATRFLYLQWAIPPWRGTGKTLKDYYDTSKMVFYLNDSGSPIVPGDVITEDGSSESDGGHAMVVTGVTVDANGTGTVTILEQNSILDGDRDLPIKEWDMGTDPWTHKHIQGWLHVKANTANGDSDSGFALTGTGLNGPVTALGLQSTGKIIVGGDFTVYNEVNARNHIARLNADGSLDATAFNGDGISITSGTVQIMALKVQPDDKVLISGQFDHYNTSNARANLARLNSDGSIDAIFTPPALMTADSGAPSVNAIALQADGSVIIGGNFSTLDSVNYANIARLDPTTGAVDSTFSVNVNGPVFALAVQTDGKILIGGKFSHVDGHLRGGLARLNSNGTLDTGFAPAGIGPAGQSVNSIAFQSIAATEDKILIAGDFATYNGTSRNGVARLSSSNGSLDSTFNPGTGIAGTTPYLKTVLPQLDGRILIGGNFATYNSVTAFNFLRLNYDGSRDTTFLSRGDFSSTDVGKYVNPILLQSDEKIVLGGQFNKSITRLLNSFDDCYSLTTAASPSSGGSVDVDLDPNCPGSKFISGTVVTLTASPNTDLEFRFIGWSGGAAGTSNPLALTMTENKTEGKSITANFLDPPHGFGKLTPEDGTANMGWKVTFTWEPSDNAASYEVCLDPADSGLCETDDYPAAWQSVGNHTTATIGIPWPNGTYHWNVRARNQVDTTHADSGTPAWSFSRDSTVLNVQYMPVIRK